MNQVRFSLESKPINALWIEEAQHLLTLDSERAVDEYRRFIELVINERGAVVPSKLVDEFWHQTVKNISGSVHG